MKIKEIFKLVFCIVFILALILVNIYWTNKLYDIKCESCTVAMENTDISDVSGYAKCYQLINHPLLYKIPLFILMSVLFLGITLLITIGISSINRW